MTWINLAVERGDRGLWHVTSAELPGFRVTEKDLESALTETYPVLAAMWECLRGTDGAQRDAYAPLFADAKK